MPTLSITLLRASDLPASDLAIQGGKSDPFVRLQLGSQQFQSSCIKKSLHPVWQPAEKFEFDVINIKTEVVKIEVFDADTFNRDDLLGTLALPVIKFANQGDAIISDSYGLDVPESFSSQNRKSTITLEIKLKLQDANERVFKMWENEKYTTTGGWVPSDAKERLNWSSFDDKHTSNKFEEVAPGIPDYMESKGWGYTVQHGDTQGWMYASTFAGPWSLGSTALSYVRRRLWENVCTSKGNQSGPSAF